MAGQQMLRKIADAQRRRKKAAAMKRPKMHTQASP